MLLLLVILTIGLCLWGKAIQWQKISSLKTSDKQFFSLSVKSFAGIVGLLLSLGYIVMIVLSRLNERGFGYLNENLFYLYPIILFAQVFFYKFIITSTEDNFPHQRWVKYGLTLCLLLGIMLNGFKNFNLNIDLKKISERQIKERVINVNDYYMFQKYAARGGLYFKQGAYNAALKDLNQALKIYPFSADVYSTRGLVFDQQGMSDLALADYNTAIKINPTYDVALASRAVLYKQRGEYDLALEDFKKTVLINPVQPTIYNDLGNIYNRKRDFPSAIESYNQAINYDPKMMEAYLNRGIAYTQLKMYSLALNDFNQALQINPLDVKALYQRSEVYAQIGRVDEALEDNNNLIRMIPDYGLLYFNRSKIYKLKQDKQKAMEDALRAKSLGWDVDEEYIQEITRIKN